MTERYGHYKVIRKIGEGAMGKVFEGLDEELNMRVALKVLSPAIMADKENLTRFEREARAAANLKHPNIAHVFFVGHTNEGVPFYAMEYIDGIAMSDIIAKKMRVTGLQKITLMQQTLAALKFSADKGVMHRDVKPGNVMIESEGGAKLVDFGIAKLTQTDENLTATGMALGTPKYISPEQASGKAIDFHADMYSLGVTFFELVTGIAPYKSETAIGLIMMHIKEPIPDITSLNPQYPRSLGRIIERMMAKSPKERYPSYSDIIAELDAVVVNETDFVESEWTFCDDCGFTTRLKDDEHCSRCGASIEPPSREEVFMQVKLLGFSQLEGKAKVIEYMKQTTGRSANAIRMILRNLPLTLAPKIEFEKAKELQRRFYEMGAEIELQKVATRKVKMGVGRPRLKLEATGRYGLMTSPTTSKGPISLKKKRPVLLWGGIAAILVGLAAVGLTMFSGFPGFSSSSDSVSSSAPVAKKSAPVAEAQRARKAAPAADLGAALNYTTSAGRCHFEATGLEDDSLLIDLGKLCEQDLYKILTDLNLSDIDRMSFFVDGTKDFSTMVTSFGMDVPESAGVIPLYAQWMRMDKKETQATLAALIVRRIVRQLGEETAPRWLETGLSLAMMNRLVPNLYKPRELLMEAEGYREFGEWDQTLKRGDARAHAQAASFVSYLADNYEFSATLNLVRSIGQGEDEETAFKRIFLQERADLLSSWYHQL